LVNIVFVKQIQDDTKVEGYSTLQDQEKIVEEFLDDSSNDGSSDSKLGSMLHAAI